MLCRKRAIEIICQLNNSKPFQRNIQFLLKEIIVYVGKDEDSISQTRIASFHQYNQTRGFWDTLGRFSQYPQATPSFPKYYIIFCMCGAYGLGGFSGFKSSINILLRFQLQNKPEVQETLNIRPTMKSIVVTRNSPNTGRFLQFGIEAPWKEGMLLINAKSETVSQLRTYKKMFQESRCLVPASFYFEWQKHSDGTKTPFCFKVKGNDVFSFAGIYNETGFVILTTKPNKLGAKVHDRMPVILDKQDEDIWLNPKSTESVLTDLFAPFPENKMEAYPVSSLVNSARNQGKEILESSTPRHG